MTNATQQFVPIRDVKNGIITLKDGGMRAVLLATSINFALKSSDEQQGIILQFQSFLNTIDFSVQIFVESRRLDIRPYTALLEGRFDAQENELLKIQTREYIQFIKNFTDNTAIMTKSFFIVIPYSPSVISQQKSGGVFGFLKRNKEGGATTDEASFEENRVQLEQRVSIVEQGMARCGVKTALLNTEEVIELFYKLFNPGDTEKAIKL
jgi:hypothetical protein